MSLHLFSEHFYRHPRTEKGFAYVSDSGTIAFKEPSEKCSKPSFLSGLRTFFSFKANSELQLIDNKLCQIFAELQSPESAAFQHLTLVAKEYKYQKFTNIFGNILHLHEVLKRGNEKRWVQNQVIRVINVFRSCLGWKALDIVHYKFADFTSSDLFKKIVKVEKNAFALTQQQLAEIPRKLEILTPDAQHEKYKFSAKCLYKMQLDLRKDFKYFILDNCSFYIHYTADQKTFSLQLISCRNKDDFTELEKADHSFTKEYSVLVKSINKYSSESDAEFKLTTKKVITVNNSLFSGSNNLKNTPSVCLTIPFDREIQITYDEQKEPFRFIIRS